MDGKNGCKGRDEAGDPIFFKYGPIFFLLL